MKRALFLLILLSSCNLEERIKRAESRAERKIEKLILKFPGLASKDTIRDTIEVVVPSVKHDTSFVPVAGDTVLIEKDRLKIQYVTRNDSVFITGECKGDTIYKVTEIPCETISIEKESDIKFIWKKIQRLWWVALLIVAVLIGLKTAKRFGLL